MYHNACTGADLFTSYRKATARHSASVFQYTIGSEIFMLLVLCCVDLVVAQIELLHVLELKHLSELNIVSYNDQPRRSRRFMVLSFAAYNYGLLFETIRFDGMSSAVGKVESGGGGCLPAVALALSLNTVAVATHLPLVYHHEFWFLVWRSHCSRKADPRLYRVSSGYEQRQRTISGVRGGASIA